MWILYVTESIVRGSTWALARFARHLKVPSTLARASVQLGGFTAPFDDLGRRCERIRKMAVSLAEVRSITSLDGVPGSPAVRLLLRSFSIFSHLNSIHHLWNTTALEATTETLSSASTP
jgi:hypothetical protein